MTWKKSCFDRGGVLSEYLLDVRVEHTGRAVASVSHFSCDDGATSGRLSFKFIFKLSNEEVLHSHKGPIMAHTLTRARVGNVEQRLRREHDASNTAGMRQRHQSTEATHSIGLHT